MSGLPKVCKIAGCKKPVEARGWCLMHYQRWRRFGDPHLCWRSLAEAREHHGTSALKNSGPLRNALGRTAEIAFEDICRRNGRDVQYMGAHYSYDFLIDHKWKVDVKASNPQRKNGTLYWSFGTNNHKEPFAPDFYVFRFEGIPFVKLGIFTLLPGSIKQKGCSVTIRSLLSRFGAHVEDFKRFVRSGTVPQLRSGAR